MFLFGSSWISLLVVDQAIHQQDPTVPTKEAEMVPLVDGMPFAWELRLGLNPVAKQLLFAVHEE